MKVALVTSIPRGGPVEHALLLGRDLKHRGVAVAAAVPTAELAERFIAVGVPAVVLPLRAGLDVAGSRRVRAWARGAHVVHSHDRRSGLWMRLLPRPRPGTALVHSMHGLPEPYLPPPIGRPRAGLRAAVAYRGLERGLTARTDALLVPSEALADVLCNRLGYARRRMSVVPNGVDVPSAATTGGELVGTLSVLEPVKGMDVFLRAAAQVAAHRPEQRFAVYGTGSLAAELRVLARRLGIGDRVSFPGYVAAGDALPRLAVLVLPSWYETGSLTLLQAMAAGIPAVASRVGCIPEMAPAGSVELTEPGDAGGIAAAVLRLLEDRDLAASRRQQGRAAAAGRSAVRTAEATLAAYERALSRRAPGGSDRDART